MYEERGRVCVRARESESPQGGMAFFLRYLFKPGTPGTRWAKAKFAAFTVCVLSIPIFWLIPPEDSQPKHRADDEQKAQWWERWRGRVDKHDERKARWWERWWERGSKARTRFESSSL